MTLLEQFLLPFGIGDSKASSPPSPTGKASKADPKSPSVTPDGAPKKHRTVALQGYSVPWLLKRTRRKTVGMSIGQGMIQVNAPRWVPISDIEYILQEKSKWLLARLAEWHQSEQHRLLPEQQWAHGASLQYLGKPLTLLLTPQLRQTQWDDFRRELQLALSTEASLEQIRDTVHAWLQSQAKALFARRLKAISEQSGRRYTKFSLSNARGRWGSCTEDGHIRLNWRLIHFGQEVIDYVIAHELAHTHTMDHGRSFWEEVAEILPTFEEGKSVLRKARLDTLPTF
ncbi:MAG: M48 family metallopeptidase [Betaproteobacteria bacterium]|jgi:predicted metal-dependent hydrolase